MKKVLYVYGATEFHPTKAAGELLAGILKRDGRFELDMTPDLDVFINLPDGKYDAVIVYTTGLNDQLKGEREKGLLNFVKNGGGFVGIHSAVNSFRDSYAYIDMLGSEFITHSSSHDFTVSIVNKEHYITTRVPDFNISDEMYHINICVPSKVTILAQTPWQNKQIPLAYVKEYGKGRVAYLANGHDLRVWKNLEFQKLLIRSLAWSTGAEKPVKKVCCGILGFGGMASGHARWITGTEGLELVAVCDISPERIEVAKHTYPGLKGYFTDIEDMLVMDGLDLVVVVLPHNLHAPMALKCLEAGKHVIVEKPFCITVAEADSMIDKAREKNVMLSVFHNRRWDTDYRTIMDLIDRGVIGEVFHIECFIGGYGHPGFVWRSDKEISGGIIYDWGAHFLDWILNMVRSEVKHVMGNFQKKIWYSVTNEDHGQVYIRFENGVTADLMVSNMAASKRPQWRILGSKGSIEADWTDEIRVISYAFGVKQDYKVKFEQVKDRWAGYYRNIADHLLMGEELIVKPEEARTVIAVIEAAQKSSELGMSVPLQQNR